MGCEIRGVSRFSLCDKVSYCEAMVLPSHSLPPASLLCYQPPPVPREFPRSALFEMEVQILSLCLGTSPALDSWSFSDEVKAPTLSELYKFPCPAYSDTFGTREKCKYSQMCFMEGHQGHTKVSQSQYSYCVIVADVMRGDLHLKMNR